MRSTGATRWESPSLFLIIGPVATLLAVLVARFAPRGERRPASLDPTGAGLLMGSVFLLLLAIIEGPGQGWTSSLFAGSAIGAGLLLAAFVGHARRSDHPMLDPKIFRIANLRTGSIGVAAVFFGLFALFLVNAQFLQYAKGYTPLTTGVAIGQLCCERQPREPKNFSWQASHSGHQKNRGSTAIAQRSSGRSVEQRRIASADRPR